MQSQNGRYGARLLRQKGWREGTGRPEKGERKRRKGREKKVKKFLQKRKKILTFAVPKRDNRKGKNEAEGATPEANKKEIKSCKALKIAKP